MYRPSARGGLAAVLAIALMALAGCGTPDAICTSHGCHQQPGAELDPPSRHHDFDDNLE